MKLIIVSGLSGSGKSVALHTLEDEGFYCIDNLPGCLLPNLIEKVRATYLKLYDRVAISIDARGEPEDLKYFPQIRQQIELYGIDIEVLYLHTENNRLIQRFSETRRRHPPA